MKEQCHLYNTEGIKKSEVNPYSDKVLSNVQQKSILVTIFRNKVELLFSFENFWSGTVLIIRADYI